MTRRVFAAAFAAALLSVPTGCAPRRFDSGLTWVIHRSGVTNASARTLDDWSSLRADAYLLDRLKHAETIGDVDEARRELTATVQDCHELALYAVNNEIDRLDHSSLAKLWRRYFPREAQPADMRETVRARFWEVANARYDRLIEKIEGATAVDEIHDLARSIRRAAGPAPTDRHGGGVLLALIAASTKEDRGPPDRGGPLVDLYDAAPETILVYASADGSQTPEDRLLVRYAPVIVQERLSNPPYDPVLDRIGTVKLEGRTGDYKVVVDTTEPSVYGYWQHTWVNGRRHLQLTYTYWFREHPKLKPVDPEQGKIEGATLRITLDSRNKPAIFETLLNCGCYHRCYPAKPLELAACDEYGSPAGNKKHCVERPVPRKMDWIVPESVDVPADGVGRPILFSRAGYHGPAGVCFDQGELDTRTIRKRLGYRLRPYRELEHLKTRDGFGSMFGPDGLVRGAGRLEGVLLAPTGMLSAGQPRQRGTQLLHWDQYYFDDPHLLEKCLRLPSDF